MQGDACLLSKLRHMEVASVLHVHILKVPEVTDKLRCAWAVHVWSRLVRHA